MKLISPRDLLVPLGKLLSIFFIQCTIITSAPYYTTLRLSKHLIHTFSIARYLDPEYFLRRHLTTASDVYAYGVCLLELITGQQSIDHMRLEEFNLIEWVSSSKITLLNGSAFLFVCQVNLTSNVALVCLLVHYTVKLYPRESNFQGRRLMYGVEK